MVEHDGSRAELRERLAQGLRQALSAGAFRAGWGALVGELWAELARTPVRRLVDRERLGAALEAALARESLGQTTLPLGRRLARLILDRLQQRGEPVGSFVPPAARAKLDQLVARDDVIPADLVRKLTQDPAVEAVIHDVLLEALRQFSVKANPFTADWGLPALLKHLPPFGFGALKSAFETRRGEFEARIEPEIRKFLQGFSRRAVQQATELTLRRQSEPEFAALRQRILAAVLERPVRELGWPADDPRTELALDAAAETVAAEAVGSVLRQELATLLDGLLAAHGDADETVAELCARWGTTLPDPGPWAAAWWPVVEAALDGEAMRRAITRAVDEALDMVFSA